MTTKIGGIVVDIDARLTRLEKSLAKASSDFSNFDKRVRQQGASIERSVSRIDAGFAKVGRAAAGMFVGISFAVVGRELASIADAAKGLEAQLRLATSQSGSFAKAQEDVRRISAATRSGLADTATLYGNFQRNAAELGITQGEAARATETFAKTLKISGAGAAESGAAIRQFSQALASGVLRGDEFNSIMENSPRLARLLADSLNVPVGSLRAMAEQGQLTADKLTAALTDTKFTAGIDAEFRELPVTFDQAMEQVHNAAIIAFGAFDRGGEFSTALANFVVDGSGGFAQLEASAENFGVQTRAVLAGLGDAFGPLVNAGLDAFNALSGASSEMGFNIRRDIQKSFDDIDRLTRFLANRYNNSAITAPLNWLTGDAQGSNLGGRFRMGSDASARQSTMNRIMRGDPFSDFGRPAVPRVSVPRAGGGGGGAGRRASGGGRARSARAAKAEQTAAQIRDSLSFEEGIGFANSLDFETPLVDLEKISAELTDIPGLMAGIDKSIPDLSKLLPIEEQERIQRFSEEFAASFSGAFEEAFLRGDIKGAFRGLLEDMTRLILRLTVIEPLARRVGEAMASIGRGGGGGGKGGLLSTLLGIGQAAAGAAGMNSPGYGFSSQGPITGGTDFSGLADIPAFAAGGTPRVGSWALVGERGPELVKFGAPATVYPNHRLGEANAALSGGEGGMTRVIVDTSPMLIARIVQGDQAAEIGGEIRTTRSLNRSRRRQIPTGRY